MSWVSSQSAGRGGAHEETKKATKWLMRQNMKVQEQNDQQTVFLLNLLQEHKLEIEVRQYPDALVYNARRLDCPVAS